MNTVNLSLAYTAGFLSVLAPCALPMLPSYITYFLGDDEKQGSLRSSVVFGLTTSAGFLTIFLVIGILPSFALNTIASKLTLISHFLGVILIIMGVGSLLSDHLFNIPVIQTATSRKKGMRAFYLYGLGFGAASMSCSFPIFMLLVLQSATAGGAVSILLMFAAYGLGASTVIVPLSVALSFGKEVIYHRLTTVIPHIQKINAAILIIAGAYMVYTGIA